MPTRPDFTIVFLGQEIYDKDRVSWTKYRYTADFPAQLVTVFDTVWPLSRRINKKVSDFGITFISKQGRKFPTFYGGRRSGLPTFWFELQSDQVPPSWVYLAFTSPPAHRQYKSNLAETTL